MISAYGDEKTVATALQCGAGKFMAKPVNFAQLKKDVSAVIAHGGGRG